MQQCIGLIGLSPRVSRLCTEVSEAKDGPWVMLCEKKGSQNRHTDLV